MKKSCCWLLLGLALTSRASADAPPACRAEARMIVVPALVAPGLLAELRDEGKAPAALTRLEGMIARGEAELAAEVRAGGAERQQLQGFAGSVYRYAVVFEDPPAGSPSRELVPAENEERQLGGILTVALTRTATAGVLVASFDLRHVRLEKLVPFLAGPALAVPRRTATEPEFSVVEVNGQSTFTSGRPALVTAQPVPGGEGKMEFFFLTVTTSSP